MQKRVFVTGATGYLGTRIVPALEHKGHQVSALVRAASLGRLRGGTPVIGDALNADTYVDAVAGHHTFVHLVGVSHPSPSKARQFREIDEVSATQALRAALRAGIKHFVYLSVAHPAPVMKEYIAIRMGCEAAIRASGINATFVRPWYVLGPGHRWPLALRPFYWLAERIPATGDAARRLGLVTIGEMIETLVAVVENPASGCRAVNVPDIRARRVPIIEQWEAQPS